jgi:TPR repeat protein
MLRVAAGAFLLMVTAPAFAGLLAQPNCFTDENPANCVAAGKIESIYIYDTIEQRDFEKIAYIASQLPQDKLFPKVILNSDGGSLSAGIGIGRILRWRRASVETHDIFMPDRSPMCYSACVVIAAGAVERNLDTIGIHSGHTRERIKGEQYKRSNLADETKKRLHQYYIEMGINPEIIEIENATPTEKMTYFDFVLEKPLEQQKIYQLGFRMRGADATDIKRLGLRSENRKESTGSLDDLAAKNNSHAQYQLGYNFLYGLQGWRKNVPLGLGWLNKSADQDNVFALHTLATIYSFGYEGIEIDEKKAIPYYLRAAKLGHGQSQNNLAWSYYKGEGVEKNIFEAIYWATKATERGDYFSYGSLGAIRYQTDGFVRDDIETYKWLKLGTDLMPTGDARDGDLKLLAELKSRMTEDQIRQGDELVKAWKPLVQSQSQMRDKND